MTTSTWASAIHAVFRVRLAAVVFFTPGRLLRFFARGLLGSRLLGVSPPAAFLPVSSSPVSSAAVFFAGVFFAEDLRGFGAAD